ncbi:hypothetical protein ACCC88_17640 [Sphingomonas sp. Sphisp140]|uniref:hypothetical protein n=1 Tax=unclassified Sphingomonas TaxID=196159 RepID=UPI0039AFD0DD
MVPLLALSALALLPLQEAPDPARISETDAIECRISVPDYNGFALSLGEADGIAQARHWKKIDSANPFLSEYELPSPITVAGSYRTTRIAFSANAILAILDVADPAVIARGENVPNAMDPDPMIEDLARTSGKRYAEVAAEMKFRKFLGERIVSEKTEPAKGEEFGTHMVVARSISNATSHPGKTLYGCSYRMEILDKDGKPL